ncbi:hypothetical protein, partial [Klebsiella pneumoniae]|uniref:hypothetical protein n=1 Tax=Klebsiella pneumoniae TaxID=573 RepID=UPI001966F360
MVYPTRFVQNKPKLFESAPVGDYPLTIYLAHQGTVYYIDEYMSAYRVGDPSSWTERIASDGEKILNHYVKSLQMLDNIN